MEIVPEAIITSEIGTIGNNLNSSKSSDGPVTEFETSVDVKHEPYNCEPEILTHFLVYDGTYQKETDADNTDKILDNDENSCEIEITVTKKTKKKVGKKYEKRFKCHICEYKTSQKAVLKRHIVSVHEGRKDFKCTHCEYKTYWKAVWRQHIASVHEGRKDFKCDQCDYSASRSANLKRHKINVHEGRRDFQCTFCAYKASRKANLEQHISSVHERRKDFKCPICEFRTSRKSILNRHVIKMHERKKNPRMVSLGEILGNPVAEKETENISVAEQQG